MMRPTRWRPVAVAFSALLASATTAAIPFTEEAASRGLVYVTDQAFNRGQGVAFADLDGDGDPDLIATGSVDGTVGVFENDGTGCFQDRAATSGIAPITDSSSITLADYDLDGDLDAYVGRYYNLANVLLRNDGGFQFTDVTAEAGVGGTGNTYGCTWGDVDNDGWMDLYVGNRTTIPKYPEPNAFYRNLGDGTFEEVAAALGIDRGDDPTLQATFLDFDQDGDADLYLSTDKGTDCVTNRFFNHLFENVGGTFVDITASSGTAACADAMCVAAGDFDGNQEFDIYVTNTPPGNVLLLNLGNAVFARAEDQAGVACYEIGWSASFFDYDNDGAEDLYVCNMNADNRFYHNGPWPVQDIAVAMGVDAGGDSFGFSRADIDDDGDIDFVVQTTNEALELFVNQEGTARRWIKFDVVGEGAARHAIGATVRAEADGVVRIRQVIAGDNYKCQNDLQVHIGVGLASTAEVVTVLWPGGSTRTVRNMGTRRTWTLYPWDKLGDGDGDGDRDLDDFFAFQACLTGDDPGALQPGCEMMDYEGDGDVDLSDFDAFLLEYDGVIADCNDNGIPDLREILDGSAPDEDGDGMIDGCPATIGDLNGDGTVDFADILILLGEWGQSDSPADLNGDGTVDFADLIILLSNWG